MSYVARPYAKAVFELAAAEKQLSQWSETLEKLAAIIKDPKVTKLMKNPQLTASQKAELIINLFTEKNAQNEQVNNFINLLAEKKRLLLLPEIAQLFAKYREESERVLNIQISSAIALPNDVRDKLLEVLSDKLDRKIKLQSEINPDLIGGILIRAGDLVIDASVRGELERLRANLIN